MKRIGIICFLGLVVFSASLQADVRLANIFGDNMILQRGQQLMIFGWSDPGTEVTVTLDDQIVTVMANENGRWVANMNPIEIGDPFDVVVQGENNSVTIRNCLAGEVWICSGQSNMEWRVKQTDNAEEEIADADFPMIRHCNVENNTNRVEQDDVQTTGWRVCSPKTVGNFTAVGYYFGRKLHRELNVPIGLINTTWGGTIVEAWTSANSLRSHPDFKDRIDAKKEGDLSDNKQRGPNNPTVLYNAMVNGLVPISFRGVVWYQGESNASRAFQYRSLFPLLIQDWRHRWNRDDDSTFSFYWVQLANFNPATAEPGPSRWAELREAQSLTLALPKTGEAVIIDIGEADNIHPRNKQDVGLRLAFHALALDYGKKLVWSGPRYRDMTIKGNKVHIAFDHLGGGLIAKGDELKRFEIAGADKDFHWAVARIEGDVVVVSSEQVKAPVAVRYAWANNPEGCNLYNKAGLPGSPFRTDDWPGLTAKTK